jgi:Ca2+/Na+ antiporter
MHAMKEHVFGLAVFCIILFVVADNIIFVIAGGVMILLGVIFMVKEKKEFARKQRQLKEDQSTKDKDS